MGAEPGPRASGPLPGCAITGRPGVPLSPGHPAAPWHLRSPLSAPSLSLSWGVSSLETPGAFALSEPDPEPIHCPPPPPTAAGLQTLPALRGPRPGSQATAQLQNKQPMRSSERRYASSVWLLTQGAGGSDARRFVAVPDSGVLGNLCSEPWIPHLQNGLLDVSTSPGVRTPGGHRYAGLL